jgi:hypothetical protein
MAGVAIELLTRRVDATAVETLKGVNLFYSNQTRKEDMQWQLRRKPRPRKLN